MKHSKTESIPVFVHIPKTAGTTLHTIMERQYHSDKIVTIHTHIENAAQISRLQQLPTNKKQEIQLIKGHTFFGWHEFLPQPCLYFTILRDPIERFISNYFFLLKKKGHPLGQKLVEQNVTLAEFVNWTGEDNYQTRYLAKNIGEKNLDIKNEDCTRQTLELAKKNLAENFAVVGTVEEFDKTLLILKNTFKWKNIYYRVKNKNIQRPASSLISQQTLDLIEEKNKFDLELYQYASQSLEDLIKKQGSFFEHELSNFKKTNNSSLGQFSVLVSSSANKIQKTINLNSTRKEKNA